MKKMVTSSLVLALLFSVVPTSVSSRSITEQEMNALLDGSTDDQAVNNENASDAQALNAEDVRDVKSYNSDEESPFAEGDLPFGQDMDELLKNPEFQEAFAEVEKMQKEDPEKFEAMMQESMKAFQEMMQDPEAMKAMMENMPEELLAEVAAEGKADELVNGVVKPSEIVAGAPAAAATA